MKDRLILALLALLVIAYILPLGARPLFVPDEVRYAEISREMNASGDWVVPRLDGFRYFEKPVMGYWLIALSQKAFGENNFAVRLPSALAAALTALAMFLLVGKCGGGWVPAALTAAVFLTMGGVCAIGSFCVLDMPLTMFLSVGLVFFSFAYKEEDLGRKALHLALFGVCCGCAFLVKGFLAFAVPCVIIGPFLLWERRLWQFLRLAWIPLAVAVLVAVPWAVIVHMREPDFWRYFFWEEHVRRFFADTAHHREPFWFYVPLLLGMAMPWTLLAPGAAAGIRREGSKDSLVRFALCWLVLPFLFFSAAKGKLGTYILPCFPPLALLMAGGLLAYVNMGKRKIFDAAAWLLIGSFLLGMASLVVWRVGGFAPALYGKGENWKVILAIASMLFWAGALWWSMKHHDGARRILWFSAAPLFFLMIGQAVVPDIILERNAPSRLLTRNANRIGDDVPLFAYGDLVQAVSWQYKRSDVRLWGLSSEFRYGAGFEDARERVVNRDDFSDFVARCSPDTLVTLVMHARHYRREKDTLPKAEFEDMNAGFVFAQYRGGSVPPGRVQEGRP